MDWFQNIDLYCERIGAGFWAEPANAVSNSSFLLASLWAALRLPKGKPVDPALVVLITLAAAIGVGSFLFHTFATMWASLTDVIPIWVFVAVYVTVAIRRFSGSTSNKSELWLALGISLLVAVIWVALSRAAVETGNSADPLNGSGQYAPALIALLVFAVILVYRAHPIRHWVVAAAVVFGVSLFFRTIDREVCTDWPIGTHFLWHALNGLMIALLLQALIANNRLETRQR